MPEGLSDTKPAAAIGDDRNVPVALGDLYARYCDELVAFVRKQVGYGPPEPEDIAHQAFANFADLAEPNGVENPRAFLYRTAANLVTNHRRHARVTAKYAAEEIYADEIFGQIDGLSPERVLLERERFALVVAAVRKMPAGRRRYFLLNRADGLTYADIARRCATSETAVRRNVLRAVRDCDLALERAERSGHGKK